jgi:hypothetical protein
MSLRRLCFQRPGVCVLRDQRLCFQEPGVCVFKAAACAYGAWLGADFLRFATTISRRAASTQPVPTASSIVRLFIGQTPDNVTMPAKMATKATTRSRNRETRADFSWADGSVTRREVELMTRLPYTHHGSKQS